MLLQQKEEQEETIKNLKQAWKIASNKDISKMGDNKKNNQKKSAK